MTRVGDVTIFENRCLPMLEVNAAYGDSSLEQPISVNPIRLEPSQPEGHNLAGTLVMLEFEAVASNSNIWVEQVAWTQAPQLARVWCDQSDARDWQALVAGELARSLERDSELLAYLAYLDDAAAGMMVASSDGICGLWAGADSVARALFARGSLDLSTLKVIIALERQGAFLEATETARFEIFMTGNSDHR